MKSLNLLSLDLIKFKNIFKRFPLGAVSSLMTALVLVLSTYNEIVIYSRIAMTLVLSLVVFVVLDLLSESYKISSVKKVLLYFTGGLIVLATYLLILDDLTMVNVTKYVGILLIFFISAFFVGKLKNDEFLENYIMKLLVGILSSIFYSAVLFIGLILILQTISLLFDITFNPNIFENVFSSVVFIFGINYFLGRIPKSNEKAEDFEYPKSIKVLLEFIVIPLLLVYTLVLYIYFAGILITWQWPKGVVANLSIWYSILSLAVLFFVRAIEKERKIFELFTRYISRTIIPILLMMFVSVFQRISQYGITENRYFVLAVGIWLFFVYVALSINRRLRTIVIPISLIIVITLGVFSPFNAYIVSKWSQNNRLEEILRANNMILDHNIISKPDLGKDIQDDIYAIVDYFEDNHRLSDIKFFSTNTEFEDLENIFGFSKGEYEYKTIRERRGSLNDYILSVEDYEFFASINTSVSNKVVDEDLLITLDQENLNLEISKSSEILYNMSIEPVLKEIINGKESSFFYYGENDAIKLMLVINSIDGRSSSDGSIYIDWMDAYIFVKIK